MFRKLFFRQPAHAVGALAQRRVLNLEGLSAMSRGVQGSRGEADSHRAICMSEYLLKARCYAALEITDMQFYDVVRNT